MAVPTPIPTPLPLFPLGASGVRLIGDLPTAERIGLLPVVVDRTGDRTVSLPPSLPPPRTGDLTGDLTGDFT